MGDKMKSRDDQFRSIHSNRAQDHPTDVRKGGEKGGKEKNKARQKNNKRKGNYKTSKKGKERESEGSKDRRPSQQPKSKSRIEVVRNVGRKGVGME